MVVAASGGSTNAALHLPAIAHEAGIDFDLHDVGEIFKRTPYIADLKPGGRYVMKDLHDVGGVPVLMKALLDGGYLHGDCMTVTGKTIAENLASVRRARRTRTWCARPRTPLSPTGGLVVLKGNLAPQGAIVQGRRHAGIELQVPRPGALLRPRGGLLRRGRGAPIQGGRRDRDPLRGPARRARACARCCRRPRRSTARAWATRWRSSPTGASRAARAASASAMSGPRRRSAGRSACCATAT